MIVVAVLGILAAIALPTFQGHVTEARQATAKDNLRTLRIAIERYAAQHNGVPPGYLAGVLLPDFMIPNQFLYYTSLQGEAAGTRSTDFPYGPYLSKMPRNSFNDKTTLRVIGDADPLPESADGSYGWLYKPAEKEIRLDWPGTDTKDVRYYDY